MSSIHVWVEFDIEASQHKSVIDVIVTVRAQETLVSCRASNDCRGGADDDLGLMSIEQCCLNDGFGFFQGEICSPCIGE